MVKKIGIAFAALIVVFIVVVAMQPSTFRVERSLVIAAPADVVFAQINVMKNRHAWYPWDQLDPNMKLDYSGPEQGVGAVYAWSGNKDVGKGRQTILESVENQKVVDDLEFIEPFAAKNKATFALAAEGDGTKVTWSMEGTNDFMGKAFGMFMSMDAMIGKDFEAGLKNLSAVSVAARDKALADEAAKKAAEEAAKPADGAPPAPTPAATEGGGKAG